MEERKRLIAQGVKERAEKAKDDLSNFQDEKRKAFNILVDMIQEFPDDEETR